MAAQESAMRAKGLARYDHMMAFASGRLRANADPQLGAARREIFAEAWRINPDVHVDFAETLVTFEESAARAHGKAMSVDGFAAGGFGSPDRIAVNLRADTSPDLGPESNWRVVSYHELWHSLQALLTQEEKAAMTAVFRKPEGSNQDERNADAFAYWVTQVRAPKGNIDAAAMQDRRDRHGAWRDLWSGLKQMAQQGEATRPGALGRLRAAGDKAVSAFGKLHAFTSRMAEIYGRRQQTPVARMISAMGLAEDAPSPGNEAAVRKVFETVYSGEMYKRSRVSGKTWNACADYAAMRDILSERLKADPKVGGVLYDIPDASGRRMPAILWQDSNVAISCFRDSRRALTGDLSLFDRSRREGVVDSRYPHRPQVCLTAIGAAVAQAETLRNEWEVAGVNLRKDDAEAARRVRYAAMGATKAVYADDANVARDVATSRALGKGDMPAVGVVPSLRQEMEAALAVKDGRSRHNALARVLQRYDRLSGEAEAVGATTRNANGQSFGGGTTIGAVVLGMGAATARNDMAKALAGVYSHPDAVADLVAGNIERWGVKRALHAIRSDPKVLGPTRLRSFGAGDVATQAVMAYASALDGVKAKESPASAYSLSTALQARAIANEAGGLNRNAILTELSKASRGEAPGAMPVPVAASGTDPLANLKARLERGNAGVAYLETFEKNRVAVESAPGLGEAVRVAIGDMAKLPGVVLKERGGALLAYTTGTDRLLAVASPRDGQLKLTEEGERLGLAHAPGVRLAMG